jgi:hypothetical protein
LFLDTRRRTCEIQFSQILTFTATTSLPTPEDSFRHSTFLSKVRRRQLRKTAVQNHSSWRSQKLKDWASSNSSSLILVKGSCLTRHETKDFATDLVALLRTMKIPVAWTLSAKAAGSLGWRSPVDVLKQLVLQVLHLNQALLLEQSLALNAARFQSATTESDWFGLLGLVLRGLSQIFIAVDAEILSREFSSELFWPEAFLGVFQDLQTSSPTTTVKVVLVSFGATPYLSSETSSLENITLRIEKDRRPGSAMVRKQHFRSFSRIQGAEALRPFLTRPEGGL